ncbi:MAG TPA: STAS domain-containing protein [Verrucomicrobiae bacterium]|nr:STAS domain-containing protein [Verrucomicrobiae bacterium]
MQLILQAHNAGEAVVVRCRGRVVSGDEARFLQSEVDKLTGQTKNVVLQMAEVSYVDSGGLGALVRLLGVLRGARGDLKLCQLPPFVMQVLRATNLLSVFHPYESEKDAIDAFSGRGQAAPETFEASNNRIVCLDSSLDLLAYLKVLLRRSGYEVFVTQYPSDAVAMLMGARSSLVICGPGMRTNEAAMAKIRQSTPDVRLVQLPADFSTSEADQAGPNLVNQVRSMLAPPR